MPCWQTPVNRLLMLLLLSGCGADTNQRYVGTLTGDGPAPCPASRAVLLVRGSDVRFVPDEGTPVLAGGGTGGP